MILGAATWLTERETRRRSWRRPDDLGRRFRLEDGLEPLGGPDLRIHRLLDGATHQQSLDPAELRLELEGQASSATGVFEGL